MSLTASQYQCLIMLSALMDTGCGFPVPETVLNLEIARTVRPRSVRCQEKKLIGPSSPLIADLQGSVSEARTYAPSKEAQNERII